MSDESSAPAGDDTIVVSAPANLDAENVSESQAYDAYMAKRSKPAESADTATAATELADEANADPEKAPSEEPTEAEPEENLPLIEPPRSWTKEEKEEFQTYPRAAQEKIAAREQARETALRRTQNEAAETRKAAEALQAQAEQARKAYEAKLPEVEQVIQDFLSQEYSDIKSMADVEKMAREDPFRKIQWDTHQQKIAAIRQEAQEAKARQSQEQQSRWNDFITKESKLLSDHIPEADIKTYSAKAGDFFQDLGFSQEERNAIVNGERLSPFDHRIQRMAFEAMKYRELKAAPPKVVPKTVPPVQRPGVAAPKGATQSENYQALTRKLTESGSVEDAFARYQARQRRA